MEDDREKSIRIIKNTQEMMLDHDFLLLKAHKKIKDLMIEYDNYLLKNMEKIEVLESVKESDRDENYFFNIEEIKYNIRREKSHCDCLISSLERDIIKFEDKTSLIKLIELCEKSIAEYDIKMQLTKGDI
jgi:hypothetical protein